MSAVLRPLAFGEIFDNAFTLYRRNFATLFVVALLLQLPVVLAWLLAPSLTGDDFDAFSTLSVVLMPYSLAAYLITMGALVDAGAKAYAGERPGILSSLGSGFAHLLTLLVAGVLAGLAMFLGFILLIVPGLIALAMFFGFIPAAVLENLGPFAALGRSRALSRGARLQILGALLVAWLLTALPTFALTMVAGVGIGMSAATGAAAGDSGIGMLSYINAASALLTAATIPFVCMVTLMLYYDRRARTEAPDLEAAVAGLSRSAV